jgi:hypothetical protein
VASITEDLVGQGDHVVQFYEHADELTEAVGRYLTDTLASGGVAVVVATEPHRVAFETRLAAAGLDVTQARSAGTLVVVDASDAISGFLVDNRPDPARFDAVIGDVMRSAAATGRAVRAYGEMVALLWEEGHVTAAIELESLWNDLAKEVAFSLYCAYPVASVRGDDNADAFHEVCALHSAVIGDAPFEAARTFDATLASPRAARRFVTDALDRWGYADLVVDAATIVAELAANAVMHARSSFTVAVSSRRGGVRIAVRDTSTCPPALRDAGLGFSGRGLRLVTAIAARWGTDLLVDGKVVWAELRV